MKKKDFIKFIQETVYQQINSTQNEQFGETELTPEAEEKITDAVDLLTRISDQIMGLENNPPDVLTIDNIIHHLEQIDGILDRHSRNTSSSVKSKISQSVKTDKLTTL